MESENYKRRIDEHELKITKPTVIRFYRRGKKLHYALPRDATGGVNRLTEPPSGGDNPDSQVSPGS